MESLRNTFLVVLAGMSVMCARLPTSPGNQPITEGPAGRTYTNQKAGFQITLPKPLDTSWGMTIQEFPRNGPLPDGSGLNVIIRAPGGRDGFRPALSVDPIAVNERKTLSEVRADVTKSFTDNFRDYRESSHESVLVAGHEAERWFFRATTAGAGTTFVATVLINGRVGWIIQGSGITGYFPSSEFDTIVKTIKFI